jgi:hypothetical protein
VVTTDQLFQIGFCIAGSQLFSPTVEYSVALNAEDRRNEVVTTHLYPFRLPSAAMLFSSARCTTLLAITLAVYKKVEAATEKDMSKSRFTNIDRNRM